MYILTNISQDIDGTVYAGNPTIYKIKDEAINSARKQLAEDYGITVNEVEHMAQINTRPYIISLSQHGRFEAYTVAKLPDAKEIRIKTPKGTIIAEVHGAYDEYPGIWIYKNKPNPLAMMAAVEYNTTEKYFQIGSYSEGEEEPGIRNYDSGEFVQ